jgi:uncharacterized repeat protein (TIGR03847 family)
MAFVFDSPERFVVGTVGQPGEREFYLQACARGRVVTVGLEKSEVTALAEGIVTLLDQVREVDPGVPAVDARDLLVDAAPLDGPVEADFQLERLTLAWDGTRVVVEAAGDEADTEGDRADGADEADDLATLLHALDVLNSPGVAPVAALPDGADRLTVALSVEQAYAFVERAVRVVAAGRPKCVLCGRPDGPEGHFCPRLN